MAPPWYSFDSAQTMGQQGSEGGSIVRDEEHALGSRITLERGGHAPYAITCGIYGWLVHTCFFSTEKDAIDAFDQMRSELERILELIPVDTDEERDAKADVVSDQIAAFVERFP